MNNETITKRIEKGGLTKSVTVEKVKGGYIVTKTVYGKPEDGEEYIDKTERMVTTKNPFGEDEEEKSSDDSMFSFVDKPLISLD